MNNAEKPLESKPDNHDHKKGDFLGKPGTISRRANVGCLIVVVPLFIIALWSAIGVHKDMRNRSNVSLVHTNLRSALSACEKQWKTDPTGDCMLPTSKQGQSDWGLTPDKVAVTIVNGKKGSFIASAKHYQIDKIYQIDNQGEIYIEEDRKKQKLAKERWAAEKERLKKELEKNKTARSSDGRFRDNGNGTITDTKTNLMWTKEDTSASKYDLLDWNDSKSYAGGLSTGGHSDWRMPTVKELKTIYEESKSNCFADVYNQGSFLHLDLTFADGSAIHYWASEIDGSNCAIVDFTDGDERGCDQAARSSVRAVRIIR